MDLLQMLTSQLGVTQDQAEGGAGLLFKMAKEKLGSDDFLTKPVYFKLLKDKLIQII